MGIRESRLVAGMAGLALMFSGCTSAPAVPAAPPGPATPNGSATAATHGVPSSTAPPTPTGVPSTGAGVPSNVRLTGQLPDTSATVPPGEGELGRVTISWDAPRGATGFRVYLRGCDGAVTRIGDLGERDRSLGPIQPCRPGGYVGVSALSPQGESAIAWAGEPSPR